MLSDESFVDEDLDKSLPVPSSDRVLRSSSRSTNAGRIRVKRLISSMNPSNDIDKTITSNVKQTSRSLQKIRLSIESASEHEVIEGSSQIFDVNHLKECIAKAHICPGGRLELIIDEEKNSGLFHKNGLKCSICERITDLTNFPAQSTYQLQVPNQRLYAAGAISGIGHDGIQFVLSLLGVSTPHRSNFYKQVHNLYDQLFDFAHTDFLSLIHEIRLNQGCDSKTILNLTVSLDGTWKKRGHQSLYGVVFLIDADSGYCLDFETLSKRCEACETRERTLTTKEFRRWYADHQSKCSKTWDGTAGGMEKEGAKKIFERSLEKGLRYLNMISDGDSSAYEAVKHTYVNLLDGDRARSNIANDWTANTNYVVTKEDCINHVKKRVANHLKTLKSRYTGFENAREENLIITLPEKEDGEQLLRKSRTRRRLPDGKPYGGSNGRMTKSMEQKLSDYYGLAIRQTSQLAKDLDENDAVILMQRNCRAAFMHNITQSDLEFQHSLCPTGLNSWCSYQKEKHLPLKQRTNPMKDVKRLDPVFMEILAPMINTLTDQSLLRRCLRGATQNANESINSVLWSILPKAKYHGYRSIRGAAAIAAIFFNRGRSGLIKFFNQVDISITEELLNTLLGKDSKRVAKAEDNTQRQEIIKKHKEQQRLQSQLAEEEEMDYRAGMF